MFNRWRLHRRMFHQAFRPAVIPTYHAVLLRSAHKMLFSLLQDPASYPSHFQMLVMTVCLIWPRAEAAFHQVQCFIHAVDTI